MTHTQLILAALGGLALIGLCAAFSSGRRSVVRATKGVREVTRLGGTAFRALATAALITGGQWLVVRYLATHTVAVLAALGVPALFAGASIARLLAVTELTHMPSHRIGGRR